MSNPQVRAALSSEGSARMPVVIPYEGIFIRDHYEDLFSLPWWYAYSLNLRQQEQYMEEYLSAIDIDWYSPFLVHSDAFRRQHKMNLANSHLEYVDNETGSKTIIRKPQISGIGEVCQQDYFVPYEKIEKDPARIQAIAADNAFRLYGWGVDQLIPDQKQLTKNRKSSLGFVESPFESVFNIWGFESTMLLLAEDKDLIKLACRAYLESALTTIATCASLGNEMIWIEECFSDLISPEDYRTLALPCLIPVVEAIRQAGMTSIYYFTGNPADKLQYIFAIGADAYSFEDDKKGFRIDLPYIAGLLAGKAALLGNLNAILDLQDASDEQLRFRIDEYVSLAKRMKGRFLMSLGSPVTPGTAVSRVQHYIAYAREKGRL